METYGENKSGRGGRVYITSAGARGSVGARTLPGSVGAAPRTRAASRRRSALGAFIAVSVVCTAAALMAFLAGITAPAGSGGTRVLQAPSFGSDMYNDALRYISEDVHIYLADGTAAPVSELLPSMTVKEALAQLSVELSPDDYLNYPEDNLITDNMTLKVTRVRHEWTNEDAAVPYTSRTVDTDTIPKGKTKVVSKGENGVKKQYFELTYTDGQLTGKTMTDEAVIKPMKEEVRQLGVGGVFTAPNGKQYNYSYVLNVDAVSYGDMSRGTNPHWTGMTYTGVPCKPGVLAVDPSVIPLRSSVYVIGSYGDYGVCYAADTGSAIKGNIIDIYMQTPEEMIAFGRRQMKAYVLE